MKKRIRTLSVIACIIIIFAMLFSTVFLVYASNHECSGVNCPVCSRIHYYEQFFRMSGLSPDISAGLFVTGFLLICSILSIEMILIPNTPVNLKVKFSC